MKPRLRNTIVMRSDKIGVSGVRRIRVRLDKTWIEAIKMDMRMVDVNSPLWNYMEGKKRDLFS